MVMDISQTYCGDNFTMYTNIESLYCTPETQLLYLNYISIIKKTKFFSLKATVREKKDKSEIKENYLKNTFLVKNFLACQRTS